MIKTNGGTGITRLICLLLSATMVFSYLLLSPVSAGCGGTSESSTSSSSYVANWQSTNSQSIDNQIAQEKVTLDNLLQEKIVLENLLKDPTLTNVVLQEKNQQLTTLNDRIAQEQIVQNNLLQAKNVQASIYQVSVPSGGSGINGIKVKFPAELTVPPGADYVSYTIGPYNAKILATQQLAAAKTFNETQTQYTPKILQKACSERLGSYLCSKGFRVGF